MMIPSAQLLDLLVCPSCKSPFSREGEELRCPNCGRIVELRDGKPIFTDLHGVTATFDRVERGPDMGTPWRQANWQFLQKGAEGLSDQDLVLDVGAGHGDFSRIFAGHRYISLDVIPYAEVDVVCDLTRQVPFRPNTFDAIVLMNVLEHVYEYRTLLDVLASLLKPGGQLFLSVPFMIKIHQAPSDFHRFTHYSLARLAEDSGLAVERLEGFYDPISFMNEALGNLKFRVLPSMKRANRPIARLLLGLFQAVNGLMARLVGKGSVHAPAADDPVATGYQLVLTKAGV